MANSLGIIWGLASGNLVTCMHRNILAEGCGCPWKCPRARVLFLEGGIIAVSGLVGFWNPPTGIQGSYAAFGLGWFSTKCGQDVQWWSDSENQAEKEEEVDKSQVRSSTVNSLFPWGEVSRLLYFSSPNSPECQTPSLCFSPFRCCRTQFPACPRSLTCCNLPLHGNLRFLRAFVIRNTWWFQRYLAIIRDVWGA